MEQWRWIIAGAALLFMALACVWGIQGERLLISRADRRAASGFPLTPKQEAIVNGRVDSGLDKDHRSGDLTKLDLLMTARVLRLGKILLVVSLALSVAIAAYVIMTVPEGTTYPWARRRGRSGYNEVPVFTVMSFSVIVLAVAVFRSFRTSKPGSGKRVDRGADPKNFMRSGSRKFTVIGFAFWIVFAVYAQAHFGMICLERGGVLPLLPWT